MARTKNNTVSNKGAKRTKSSTASAQVLENGSKKTAKVQTPRQYYADLSFNVCLAHIMNAKKNGTAVVKVMPKATYISAADGESVWNLKKHCCFIANDWKVWDRDAARYVIDKADWDKAKAALAKKPVTLDDLTVAPAAQVEKPLVPKAISQMSVIDRIKAIQSEASKIATSTTNIAVLSTSLLGAYKEGVSTKPAAKKQTKAAAKSQSKTESKKRGSLLGRAAK